jgi:hypothetical protein
MQRVISIIFILSASVLSGYKTAAQEIRVISAADNAPLPYATVTNRTHPLVVSADATGTAHIKAAAGDSISVSYVGYKTALLLFNGDKVQAISLRRNQQVLPDIKVYSCKRTKELTYDNYRDYDRQKIYDDPSKTNFGGFFWDKNGNAKSCFAVLVKPSRPNATLKDFSFWIKKDFQAPKSSIHTPLLINFFEVADSSGLPGELISRGSIVYVPKKPGRQKLSLDSIHLVMPSSGIYVSLQYVMNEEYEWEEKTRFRKSEQDTASIDTVFTRYGDVIGGLRSRESSFVFYNALRDKWVSYELPSTPENSFHSTIKWEVTIKYCGE